MKTKTCACCYAPISNNEDALERIWLQPNAPGYRYVLCDYCVDALERHSAWVNGEVYRTIERRLGHRVEEWHCNCASCGQALFQDTMAIAKIEVTLPPEFPATLGNSFPLCEQCNQARVVDPEAMRAKIEARLFKHGVKS